MTHKIAIVGLGKIARDQHIPSIAANPAFELAAVVSRNATAEDVETFRTLDAMLAARPDIDTVALCMPPQARFEYARDAIAAGKHVMLEKPPGATLSEVEALVARARDKGVVLYATWHSRHAPAVAAARAWLADKTLKSVTITWREDVRYWHPGQTWIWQAGGLGIFDPGINGLSILSAILPTPFRVTEAVLEFPENCETPIAARIAFADANGVAIEGDFDWRQTGPQTWEIAVETDGGSLRLTDGGAALTIDGDLVHKQEPDEYGGVYARFAGLLARGESDVDVAPLRHVADAFMLGRRETVQAFHDDG